MSQRFLCEFTKIKVQKKWTKYKVKKDYYVPS